MEEVNQPVTPPQVPDQMHSIENSHNSKVIPIIIVVVLLVLVGVGSYLLGTKNSQTPVQKIVVSPTPTPDPTAYWKTYTNALYGFSFKYPSDFKVVENKTTTLTLMNVSNAYVWEDKGVSVEHAKYFNMFLTVLDVDKNTKLKDWIIQDAVRASPGGGTKSIISGEITLYNIGALEGFSFIGGTEEIDKYVYLKKDSQIFKFWITGYQTGSNYADNKDAENIMDQILSTLKFTN